MAKKSGTPAAPGAAIDTKKPVGGKREGAGRPKLLLDPVQAEKLGENMPSNRELGAHFGVDHHTVDARLEDQPEFASALARGQAKAKFRLSASGLEQATGFWFCPACGRVLRTADPTPDDPMNVKDCPDHPREWFGLFEDGRQKVFRRFARGNPIANIWQSKQHLGYRDRSFLEEEYQRDLSKIPTGKLLELAFAAFQRMGKPLPVEAIQALQKEVESKEE